MKVLTKVVIDLKTSEVIEEEGFEYNGQVAHCGSGGGGGAGRVDYPDYMKNIQEDWMHGSGTDLDSGKNITASLNTAVGNSPYSGRTAFDPDTRISDMEAALSDLGTAYSNFKDSVDGLSSKISSFESSTALSDAETKIDNFENYVENLSTTDKVETELSQFNAGMRDINAVMSSGFTVGKQIVASSLIETKTQAKSENVKRYTQLGGMYTDKNGKALDGYMQQASIYGNLFEARHKYSHLTIEQSRIAIVAKVEEEEVQRQIDLKDAKWDLRVFQDASNVMASISGGTMAREEEDNKAARTVASTGTGAVAGAMAGAEIGTSGGGYWGAAIGAVVGFAYGMLSG